MKKSIVAILALLYLSTSVGATVHLHYCMDKLVGWNLKHSKSDRCGNCGMSKTNKQKANGCCKDEYKQLKLQSDQKPTASYQVMQLLSVAIHPGFFEISPIDLPSVAEGNPNSHSPPGSKAVPIYIRNCVFRI